LVTIAKLAAPISPFFVDSLYRNLNAITGKESHTSVHHADFPIANEDWIDLALEERMTMAQDLCSLVLSIRKKVNIRVRQPLQKVLVPISGITMKQQLQKIEALILAEVNVKEMEYLPADNDFIRKKVKANFVILGKKLGAKMKSAAQVISSLSQTEIRQLESVGSIDVVVDDSAVQILIDEVEIQSEDVEGWMVASKNVLTVALDVSISPALEKEGIARELVNRIQKIRKDLNLDLTDHIIVEIQGQMGLEAAFTQFNAYICAEILADQILFLDELNQGEKTEINGILLKINVIKNR
jgi:isoleucyl-tRNA synthetase